MPLVFALVGRYNTIAVRAIFYISSLDIYLPTHAVVPQSISTNHSDTGLKTIPTNRQCPLGILPRNHSYLLVIVERNNRVFWTLQLYDVVIDAIPSALSDRTTSFDEFTNLCILHMKIAYITQFISLIGRRIREIQI